jgi:hypothetical protein
LDLATPGRVFAFVSAILIPTVAIFVAFADSKLVLVASEKGAMKPVFNRDRYGRVVSSTALLEVAVWVENRGLKPGHIERLEVRTFSASDEYKMDVHYVDRTPLGWRDKKLLRFELIGTMQRPNEYQFELTFIDNEGREIGHEHLNYSITIEPYKPGTIAGTIVAADTGEWLRGVTVTLETPGAPKIMVTDNNGTAAVENVPPGSYGLRAQLQGYEDSTTTVELRPGHYAVFTLKMNRSAPYL